MASTKVKGKKQTKVDVDPKLIAWAEEAAKDSDNQPKEIKKEKWTFLLSIWYARSISWIGTELNFKMSYNFVKKKEHSFKT